MQDRRHDAALIHEAPRPFRRRLCIFLLVFFISCALGMSYTFMRPAIYRSTATLLIAPSMPLDETPDTTEVSAVAVQRHVVSHPSVLAAAYHQCLDSADVELQVESADVQGMLSARAIPDTNILELCAEGETPAELPLLVDAWIDAYLAAQTPAKKASLPAANDALQQQLHELEEKIQVKRDELAEFRSQHNIASLQREENRVLARLKGLTGSLNKAEEEEVTAKAQLKTLQSAIAEGKSIPLESDLISDLKARAAELQQLVTRLERIYTPDYLEADHDFADLQQQLELLNATIEAEHAALLRRTLVQAELEYETAHQICSTLKQQLDEYKQTATEFTTQFAAHEALLEDLTQLEELHRQLQQRAIQSEVMRETLPPEVSVVQRASIPESPVRPAYRRDALICLGASLLLALSAVLMDVVLTPPLPQATLGETRTVFFPWPEPRALMESQLQRLPEVTPLKALQWQRPRELSPDDVAALLGLGDPATQTVVSALVSGLSVDEVCALRWMHIDLDACVIQVPGADGRTIPIVPAFAQMLAERVASPPSPAMAVWADGNGQPLSAIAIDSMIVSAAHRAGLKRPSEVVADTLRSTYIAFLVRQGLPLDRLPELVGWISQAAMRHYELLSPPGHDVAVGDLNRVYPSLERFALGTSDS